MSPFWAGFLCGIVATFVVSFVAVWVLVQNAYDDARVPDHWDINR